MQVHLVTWETGSNFIMVALPLFVLMGQLVYRLNIAEDLYNCVEKWLGRLPGGLAVTSVVASAGFGAVTGVSAASVATMGSMTLPEMKKYKYNMGLATGSIASAGTLAILIPPSVLLIVYGIWTETSIGALFLAGIVPGILMTFIFSAYIVIRCAIDPKQGPIGEKYSWREKFFSISRLLPIISIIVVVLGGIYGGIFTPTEASGIGCAGVLVVGLLMRRLSFGVIVESLRATAATSAMIFAIIIGGHLLGRFLILTDVTENLIALIGGSGFGPIAVISIFVVMYLILGAMLDVWGMLILTIPFTFPIAVDLGFHPVWYGIFVTIMTELALITPPVGINVYVMRSIAPDVPLLTIFKGVAPFAICALAIVALIVAVPEIVLWLPRQSGLIR